jgi:hypothetical protein
MNDACISAGDIRRKELACRPTSEHGHSANGSFWSMAPASRGSRGPKEMRLCPIKNCFRNSYHTVVRMNFAIQHAWISPDGFHAIDLTPLFCRFLRSEHSVRVGTRNVRRDHRCRIFRVANDLQCVPMFDCLAVGVHFVDVDAGDSRILRFIIEKIQKVDVRPYIVAGRR